MWPDPNEGLDAQLNVERLVEDLYAMALREWLPQAVPFILPGLDAAVLTAAGELPPDPAGAQQAQTLWDKIAGSTIVAGLAALWNHAYNGARAGLGKTPPPAPPPAPRAPGGPVAAVAPWAPASPTPAAAAAIAAATSAKVLDELEMAYYDPAKAAKLAAYMAGVNGRVATVPAQVGVVVGRSVAAEALRQGGAEMLRVTVAQILEPASPEMRDLARLASYSESAAVQNDAVVSAAEDTLDEDGLSTDGEQLEKVWIATLDGRTRPTHWAADGQRVPLDAMFSVGDDELEYPGDENGSPEEVCNCRCRVGILATTEPLPDESDRHTEREGIDVTTVRQRDGLTQEEEIERRADEGNIRARDDPEGIGHVRVASGGWAAPSEQEMSMTTMDTEDTTAETFRTFTDAVVALIGVPTSDGRMLAADIELDVRPLPLPLMWTRQTSDAHLDAFTVGVLEEGRIEGDKVLASGYLLNTPEADEAADQIGHGVTGPSVDLAAAEWMLTDEDGNEITEEEWWDMPLDAVVYQTVTKAELIGTTLVATPAFGATTITLNAERETRDAALVASAAAEFSPRIYDHRLFENPNLTAPTLPTLGEDGRVYGHLACFGECHRSVQSQCVLVPRSPSNYSNFHTSPAVLLDNGDRLPVGRLTVGTGHATDKMGGAAAVSHYDNTGACFALVRVGEDAHGVWFSGVVAPWATTEQIEMGLAAPLSGDWRDFGQGLDLVAALAVNTPGFVARGSSDDQGRPLALVASLGPVPAKATPGGVTGLSQTDIQAIVAGFADELTRRADDKAAAEAVEARKAAALARAQETVGDPPTPNERAASLLARAGGQ